MRVSWLVSWAPVALASAASVYAADLRLVRKLPIEASQFRVVKRESGPDDYYTVVHDPSMPFIRGQYRPPAQTSVLGYQVADADRSKVRSVSWKWRAEALPRGGDECARGREDSAAVVYLTFKRGLRWYTLKYVWSSVGAKGATCDRKRTLFSAQDTIILESGGPLDVWKAEAVDLDAEFKAHFENGRAVADVPPFLGVGIMSDGDQTKSESAADFADFVLERVDS
jgi:Protein of unknown function (DUF3047)